MAIRLTAPSDMRIADDGGDLGARDHQAAGELDLDLDEVAIAWRRADRPSGMRISFCLRSTGIRRAPSSSMRHDADLAAAGLVEDFHRLGGVVRDVAVAGIDAGEDAIARRRDDAGIAALQHLDARLVAFLLVPLRGEGVEVVGIGVGGDIEHGDVGQGGGAAQRLAGARDDAFAFELGQHGLERPAHVAANAEHLGKIALALDVGLFGERFEQLLAAWAVSASRTRARRWAGGFLVSRLGMRAFGIE